MTKKRPKISFLQVLLSAISAAFGVQSSKNQLRDFERGKVGHYIAAGIFVTLIFITLVVIIVEIALKTAA